MTARAIHWRIRGQVLSLSRPLVMGIVNVTPDSFSDGGKFLDPAKAVGHATRLVAEGADILDVGGESTRPGSVAVSVNDEWRRIAPVVAAIRERLPQIPLSIDTRKAAVAKLALDAGAHIINDVTALGDPEMPALVARARAGIVLMHMKGEPASMQIAPTYQDVTAEVKEFLFSRAQRAVDAGIAREAVGLDPGLGFGKRTGAGIEDNAVLLRDLRQLVDLGYPFLVGASRKAFTGNLTRAPKDERLEGSLAAAAIAVMNGAHIVRVHDVKSTRRVVDFVHAVATS